MKVYILGNCQSNTLKEIFEIMLSDVLIHRDNINKKGIEDYIIDVNSYDYILIQSHPGLSHVIDKYKNISKVYTFPNIVFDGYHPDTFRMEGEFGPEIVSNIVLWAYVEGLSKEECLKLFCDDFISKLDYLDIFSLSKNKLIKHLHDDDMDGIYYFDKWHMNAPFMLNSGHPKLFVMVDVALHLSRLLSLKIKDIDIEKYTTDPTIRVGTTFPSYNHNNDLSDKITNKSCIFKTKTSIYGLESFVIYTYGLLDSDLHKLSYPTHRLARFKKALCGFEFEKKKACLESTNPYKKLPADNFWRKSVANIYPNEIQPIMEVLPLIDMNTRVATAGSCFAQHIAKTLFKQGLNYYVTETAPKEMTEDIAKARGYNLFSARYGNIYTAKQLVQLLKRAYRSFTPLEQVWSAKPGNYLDPFRPNLGEEFNTIDALESSRNNHFKFVREMFESLDVFVFTLGLTESWINTSDGSVYPVAPGIVSQHKGYGEYQFVNFSHDEILADMVEFIGLLRAVNRTAHILLTVSPVPLIATYGNDHVLSANTYSKSVLRVVADELSKGFSFVTYFPSFEIITGIFNKGLYYEEDLRTVRKEGVEHVMKVFMKYLVCKDGNLKEVEDKLECLVADQQLRNEIDNNDDIVCDEELIETNLEKK